MLFVVLLIVLLTLQVNFGFKTKLGDASKISVTKDWVKGIISRQGILIFYQIGIKLI